MNLKSEFLDLKITVFEIQFKIQDFRFETLLFNSPANAAKRFASERNGPQLPALPGHSTSECFVFCQIGVFFSPHNIQNKLPNPVIAGFHPIYDLKLPLVKN